MHVLLRMKGRSKEPGMTRENEAGAFDEIYEVYSVQKWENIYLQIQ